MAIQFSGRPQPKARKVSQYQAPYDSSGVDPDMQATLKQMQGPLGSSGAGIKFDPIADLKKMLGHLFDFGKKK